MIICPFVVVLNYLEKPEEIVIPRCMQCIEAVLLLPYARRYAFFMVFHVRWIFLTTSLRIPPESLATKVGFGDKW